MGIRGLARHAYGIRRANPLRLVLAITPTETGPALLLPASSFLQSYFIWRQELDTYAPGTVMERLGHWNITL